METLTSEADVLTEHTIVDTDVHLSLDADDIASYADEPYKSRLADEYCYPATIGSDWQMVLPGTERRSLSSPEQIQDVLVGEFGIDYPILNAPALYNRFPDPDLGVASMRAVNRLLLDTFLDDHDFLAIASLSAHKPDKAAEEINRMAAEDQIVGVLVMNTGVSPPLGGSEVRYHVPRRRGQRHDDRLPWCCRRCVSDRISPTKPGTTHVSLGALPGPSVDTDAHTDQHASPGHPGEVP